MSSMDDNLRDLLRLKADQVSPHHDIPSSLVRRVRTRVAFNGLAIGAAVVVVAFGAFVGVRALRGSEPDKHIRPVSTPSSARPRPHTTTPSPAETTPSSSPTAPAEACTAGQLRAVGEMQGAAGAREGSATVTNFSDKVCTLQGTPGVALLDEHLKAISGVTFTNGAPGWKVDGSPMPPGWPVVSLQPGQAATIRLRWTNWCHRGRSPLWQLQIGSGTVDVNGLDAVYPPPCNGPGMPPNIEIGPFEPSS